MNTKDYGVPQNRERLFLVGFLDADLYHKFHFADKIKLEKRLRDVLEDDVDEKYYLKYRLDTNRKFTEPTMFEERSDGDRFFGDNNVSGCLRAKDEGGFKRIIEPKVLTAGMMDMKGSKQVRKCYMTDGLSPTLDTMQGGHRQPKIKVPSATKSGYETATTGDAINLSVLNSKTRRGRVGKQVAQTLDTACNQAVVSERIRKLTPRECLRLQDFPDTFEIMVSNSQAYKQAGNSMSVNILEMIFNQIEKAKRGETIGLF